MKNRIKPVTRKTDIVVQELNNETLLYDLKSNKAYCLNETSALIWHLSNGRRTVSEIRDEMSARLKTPINEDFVLIALDQLNSDGLLEEAIQLDNRFAGLSRREVIKKVGFASAVALPMVSSLIAPEAANAQSMAGLPLFSACAAPTDCGSGTCITVISTLLSGQTNLGTQCCQPTTQALSVVTPGGHLCITSGTCSTRSGFCCSGNITTVPNVPGCNFPNATTCQCV